MIIFGQMVLKGGSLVDNTKNRSKALERSQLGTECKNRSYGLERSQLGTQ